MRKKTAVILAAAVVLAAGAAGTYTAIGMHYEDHFFEHTTINGIDVSDLTAQEAETLIADQAEDYQLTVTSRGGRQETIDAGAVGYRFVSGGEVQEFLDGQSIFTWLPAYFGEGSAYTMEAAVTFDEPLLEKAAEGLACMQEDQITAPADARVEKQPDGVYTVVPEEQGSEPDSKKVKTLLAKAVTSGRTSVDLEEEDCYKKPSVTKDDPALLKELSVRNRYGSLKATYQMGGGVTVTLDPALIEDWYTLDENQDPVFDREKVAAWVDQLADQYDTIGTYPPFVTSNGETVYVEARTYGWQMDRETETEELYQLLLAGESFERSPVWYEAAWTRGENDIGNTYVEIDYTNQRMWYYKDGALLVETPVVTGNVSAGMSSPEGVFCLVGKEENATLVGEDYKTPVDYWMPFYGGVGIHDADSWRTSYGGDIYQWSGSHGCINTPTAQAAVIFENIEVGTPIICYSSGTNYGYGQVGGSQGSSGGSSEGGDIVIVDGGASSDPSAGAQTEAPVIVDEGWTDEAASGEEAEFPITIEEEGSFDGEQVIY